MVLSKWTTEMTTKFVSLYKQQDCLWNTENPMYRDREARDIALDMLLADMNIPEMTTEDVKKKIKYLRSTYMVEVNKIEKSQRTGAKTYKPCLSWFNEMDSFLRFNVRKNSCKHVHQPENSNDTYEEEFLEGSEADQADSSSIEWAESDRPEDQAYSNDQVINERIEDSATYRPSGSRDPLDFIEGTSNSKRRRLEILPSPIQEMVYKEDEFDVFGKYVAIQLKTLDEEDAILAQEEIQSILTRCRLKKVRQNKQICVIAKSEMS